MSRKLKRSKPSGSTISNRRLRWISSKSMPRDTSWISCATGPTALSNTLVIECEVEFVPLYREQPLFGDVQCFLRDQHFVLHKLIDVAGRPFRPFNPPNQFQPMSQLLWADAIFVRDFTRLEAFGDDDLLKAAAVLDMVYCSYDLVGTLLIEYDRRSKTSLWQTYVSDLKNRSSLSVQVLNIMDHPG